MGGIVMQEAILTYYVTLSIMKLNKFFGKKMNFRTTASFGKRQEFATIAELLRRDFDVYSTLVDDQQIDCILRSEDENGNVNYLDIQIKARSRNAANPGTFSAMEIRKPRENYFFIFYSELISTYWIIPSLELVNLATRNKSGINSGKYSIVLINPRLQNSKSRPKFLKYENAFHLLK